MKPIFLGVPCYREDAALLRDAISSFLDPAVQVLVVDNGASGECKAVLREFDGQLQVIHNEENVYINPAWNQIAAEFLRSDASTLVIANADVVVSAGWAQHLAHAVRTPGKFWFARVVDDRAQLNATSPTPSTHPTHSAGTFFAIDRNDVSCCFPIPSELRMWYGDNWIFDFLAHMGVDGVRVDSIWTWHAGSVSSKQVPRFDAMVRQEQQEWHSRLSELCKQCAMAASITNKRSR
jgi:GT2 family glycosyltransferase